MMRGWRRALVAVVVAVLCAAGGQVALAAMPMPTPAPWVLPEWGIPVFYRHTEGIGLLAWQTDFLDACARLGVPVEDGGFLHVDEFIEDDGDAQGRSFGVYRLLAGGAELFVYAIDGETAISFFVSLDEDGMRVPAMRSGLLHYFPLVIRACIMASEEGLDDAVLDRAMASLGDIPGIITGDAPVMMTASGARGYYEFESHYRFYEMTGFSGHWQEEVP